MTYLWKVHTKCIHVQAVEKARKVFAKPCQTLMHQLKVHHVGFQICHGIREFCKCRLKCIERERRVSIACFACRLSERASRGWAQRSRWPWCSAPRTRSLRGGIVTLGRHCVRDGVKEAIVRVSDIRRVEGRLSDVIFEACAQMQRGVDLRDLLEYDNARFSNSAEEEPLYASFLNKRGARNC